MSLNTSKMKEIKTSDGYWRYIDHAQRILTTGFARRAALRANRRGFSSRPSAIRSMSKRYERILIKTQK